MKSKFISKTITYTGRQLASHFAYRNFGIPGDSIIAFTGPCRVTEELVDLEDLGKKEFIFSPRMLHFIVEHFELDLEKGILKQRLLISIIRELLPAKFKRSGDDLYSGKKKLSVSIASLSPVSTLIHAGLNIETAGTPVLTCGLKDYNLNVKKFAESVMREYILEIKAIKFARCKVRGVA